MKMRSTIIFFAAALCVAGCAMDMDRVVDVETSRIKVESLQTNGITSVNAEIIFRDVANQLGFAVKEFQNPRNPDEPSFSAGAAGIAPKNKCSLAMSIEDKQVIFVSRIYGSKEDFVDAQTAAALYEHELDQRGIQYKVSTGKRMYQ
jgi:hypothetical protein